MAEIPKDMKFLFFGKGARWHAKSALFLDFLGMAYSLKRRQGRVDAPAAKAAGAF